MSRRILLIVLASILPGAARTVAQVPAEQADTADTAERCRGPEHRQFDFWLGTWEVRSAEGTLQGHNEIRVVAGGCGLLDTYDASLGRWTQRWVGDGATLWLEGGLEDGRMVLQGTAPRATPRGDVLDRIIWEPR